MQTLALLVVLAGQVAADLPTTAVAAAKQALVKDVDPALSAETAFEEWLEDLAGPSAEIAWEANDCGEQTGDPAIDAGRDIPLCVEARVTFPDRRTLSLSIMVGTWRSGVGGMPRFRFGALDTAAGRTIDIDSLADVPAVLAGAPPVGAGPTLSTPVLIRRADPELQPRTPQTNASQAGIRVLFAAHGGIGLRPVPLPAEFETAFVVVIIEIDSPREQRGVAVTDVQLRSAGGWLTMARRIVEVEEFIRVRGEEGECAYWLHPDGTRPWSGTLPAGRIRLRVRASLADEPPSVAVSQLVIRLAVGSLVAEGPVQCRWPN